jgi:hypothetical protein
MEIEEDRGLGGIKITDGKQVFRIFCELETEWDDGANIHVVQEVNMRVIKEEVEDG